MKRCTKCKSLMPDDVFLCIRCGFDAKPAMVAPPAKPQPIRPQPPAFKPAGEVKKGKFANGLALAGQAWRVLMLDKELLIFPLLSGIACFLLLATFIGAAFAAGIKVKDPQQIQVVHWIGLFIYYFINYFIIVFFNCALVACAMIRFRGGNPTVRDGLTAARERLGLIAGWALLAATVGVILKVIEERVGFLGKIVTMILGAPGPSPRTSSCRCWWWRTSGRSRRPSARLRSCARPGASRSSAMPASASSPSSPSSSWSCRAACLRWCSPSRPAASRSASSARC
jgi:hypothetical protein